VARAAGAAKDAAAVTGVDVATAVAVVMAVAARGADAVAEDATSMFDVSARPVRLERRRRPRS
jgi:hypothetical protein